MLLSCTGSNSSSSVSSSSSSASSEVVLPCQKLNVQGSFGTTLTAQVASQSIDVGLDFQGVNITLYNDYPPESIGDLLDYTYFQSANMKARVDCELIQLKQKRGVATTTIDLPASGFDLYSVQGDLYADLSEVDLSDFGVENNKFLFPDVYSFLNDDQYRDLAALLAVPELSMENVLLAASEDPSLEEAIHLTPYDRDRYQVEFALQTDALAAIVSSVNPQSSKEEVKAEIDESFSFAEGSRLSMLYNMKTNEISGLGVNGGISFPFEPIVLGEITIDFSSSLIRMDMDAEWMGAEEFEIPPLEGYQRVEPKEETLEESSSSNEE